MALGDHFDVLRVHVMRVSSEAFHHVGTGSLQSFMELLTASHAQSSQITVCLGRLDGSQGF